MMLYELDDLNFYESVIGWDDNGRIKGKLLYNDDGTPNHAKVHARLISCGN